MGEFFGKKINLGPVISFAGIVIFFTMTRMDKIHKSYKQIRAEITIRMICQG